MPRGPSEREAAMEAACLCVSTCVPPWPASVSSVPCPRPRPAPSSPQASAARASIAASTFPMANIRRALTTTALRVARPVFAPSVGVGAAVVAHPAGCACCTRDLTGTRCVRTTPASPPAPGPPSTDPRRLLPPRALLAQRGVWALVRVDRDPPSQHRVALAARAPTTTGAFS